MKCPGRWAGVLGLILVLWFGQGEAQDFQSLYFRGFVALRGGQTGAAEAIFDALRIRYPEDPRPYLALGDVHFFRRQFARALQLYSKAQVLQPDDLRTLAGLGKWYFFAGDRTEAERLLGRVIEQRPDDLEARAYLAYLGQPMGWPQPVSAIPSSPRLSRGEVAALLAVHLGDFSPYATSSVFEVMTDIGRHWAREQILAVVGHQLMSPYQDHTFDPSALVTRAEFAQVVYNLFERVGVTPTTEEAGEAADALSDVPAEHRARTAIGFVVYHRVIDLRPEGTFDPLGAVGGQEAIEVLERAKRLLFPTGTGQGSG